MTECTSTPAGRFHWHRLFQYRLRTILIATTIIAVLLGWWSYKARQQREAVAEVCKAGFAIVYDERLPLTHWMKASPQWPEWLLESIGADYFVSVQTVCRVPQSMSLEYVEITDESLESIKRIPNLREVDLLGTSVTDSGLKHLVGNTGLKRIDLRITQVTDTGVARLQKALPNCTIEH